MAEDKDADLVGPNGGPFVEAPKHPKTATIFDVRSHDAGMTGDENQDVPLEARRELMRVAVDRSMSYHYLCAIYRKGYRDGFSEGTHTAVIPAEDRAEAIRKAQSSASSYEAGNCLDARLAEDEARHLLRLVPRV